MSNSPLVVYTKISPHSTNPRNSKIKKITIHHMAGNVSIETCGEIFANPKRKASSTYGIGSDGRIGMYCEEKNRPWTSSNRDNDHQAVTIEVANDEMGGNWHVSDKALASLIELCVDICKRNDIEKLNYTGDASGNLTMHKWFANTNCPGPYLESKFPYIAAEVNKRLGSSEITVKSPETTQETTSISVGDIVSFKGGKHYSGANSAKGYAVVGGKARVTNIVKSSKHPVHLRAVNSAGNYTSGGVYGWVDLSAIEDTVEIATPKKPTLTALKVGDIVEFVGDTHYPSTNATKGYSVKSSKAKVTAKYHTGKHKVHLRAVDADGNYIGGVYGWVDLKDIKV
jgi:hypothetical protein